jgi:serine/threonine-protein phosphatase 2A regulatory subunit A
MSVEQLSDDLADPSRENRKAAARRIGSVCAAIGADGVQRELVPFLEGKIDDDDEILLIMAEELGNCVTVFSGSDGALCLLKPLEALCHVEETVVRDAAVVATCKVIAALPDAVASAQPTEMVMHLATGDWFTKKVSACGLLATAYGCASPEGQVELLDTYVTNLCADDAPMVRRAAAKQLGFVAAKVGISNVLAKILPAYEKLCIKDTDSVRVLAMSQTSALAKLLNHEQLSQTLLRIIDDCHRDRSWRVRMALASDLGAIAQAGGKAFASASLVTIAVVLIGDPEPEVRESAIRQLVPICAVVGEEVFAKACLPEINQTRFAEEEEVKVQTAFAEMVMGLVPLISSDVAQTQLLPLITDTLRRQLDEESESFQHMNQAMINMKLKVFRQMEALMKKLPSQPAKAFTQDVLLDVVKDCCITEHYEDSYGGLVALYDTQQFNWRARQSTVGVVPSVLSTVTASAEGKGNGISAGAVGELISEGTALFTQFVAGLNDPVSAVRRAAAESVGGIVDLAGAEWFKAQLVPVLERHMGERKIELNPPRRQPNGNPGKYMRPAAGGDMDDNENVVPANWTTMPHGGYLRRIAVMHAMGSAGRHADLLPIVVRFLERGLSDPVINVNIAALKSVKRLLPDIGPSDSVKDAITGLASHSDMDIKDEACEILEMWPARE